MSIWVVNFRTLPKGGAVGTGLLGRFEVGSDAISRQPDDMSYLQAVSGRGRLAFLTHGYNVEQAPGLWALGHLADALSKRPDFNDPNDPITPVVVLWPGDGPLGPLMYPFVGDNADETAKRFAQWIDAHIPVPARLSFVSHSLGARIALGTPGRTGLARWSFTGERATPDIEQISLLAAAVRSDALEEDRFVTGAERAGRISVLYSAQDWILRAAFIAGDPFQSLFNWTRYRPRRALGRAGPYFDKHTPDWLRSRTVARQIPDTDKAGHGDYLPEGPAPDPWNPQRTKTRDFLAGALTGGDVDYPAQ